MPQPAIFCQCYWQSSCCLFTSCFSTLSQKLV